MSDTQLQHSFEHDDFDFETIEDELRVDDLCRQLLHQFYLYQQQSGSTPEQASDLAYSADYYVRDYLLDELRANVLRPKPGQVRRFAGNWYITRTLEPEITVLNRHLDGISAYYRFLRHLNLISDAMLAFVDPETSARDYYRERIEQFLALAGDGYEEWERACSLSGGLET